MLSKAAVEEGSAAVPENMQCQMKCKEGVGGSSELAFGGRTLGGEDGTGTKICKEMILPHGIRILEI